MYYHYYSRIIASHPFDNVRAPNWLKRTPTVFLPTVKSTSRDAGFRSDAVFPGIYLIHGIRYNIFYSALAVFAYRRTRKHTHTHKEYYNTYCVVVFCRILFDDTHYNNDHVLFSSFCRQRAVPHTVRSGRRLGLSYMGNHVWKTRSVLSVQLRLVSHFLPR